LDLEQSKSEALHLAKSLAQEAEAHKGEDVRILDVGDLLYLTDYFVLVTSQSARQTKAITSALRVEAKRVTGEPGHEEGSSGSAWVLCDFGTVVVHVLSPEGREFYGLDHLWHDAKLVPFGGSSGEEESRPHSLGPAPAE